MADLLLDRLLKYKQYDTQANENSDNVSSRSPDISADVVNDCSYFPFQVMQISCSSCVGSLAAQA